MVSFSLRPWGLFRVLLTVALILLGIGADSAFFPLSAASVAKSAPDFGPEHPLHIVTDGNYPPYIFRDAQGKVEGILPDLWALWSHKTGIPIQLDAMDWGKALHTIENGDADVIDTLFRTPAREKIFDFSDPYATIDVSIFFHKSISGITKAADLSGFTVGTKDGDACNDWLTSHNITSLKPYPSYESLIDAAARGEVRVFCIDRPPGLYYLYKKNLDRDFRYSPPLYSGQFHWAVRKGQTQLQQLIAAGFARISADERKKIEERWMGKSPQRGFDARTRDILIYGGLAALGCGILLLVWNRALHRQVSAKTAQLQTTLSALQTSQRHVNQLVSATPVGVYETDAGGNYLYVNDRWIEITGLPRYQALDNGWRLAVHPADRAAATRAWQQAVATGTGFRHEYRFRRSDGSVVWVLSQAVPQADIDGQVSGYIGSVTDITDRKLAEQELAHSEARFRSIFDNINDAIILQDIHSGSIVQMNRRTLEMYGFDEDDREHLQVEDLSENISPYSIAEARNWWRRAIEGQPQVFLWRARRKDGSLFWVDVNMRRISLGDADDQLLVVVRDITERRLAEEKLRESEESLRLAVLMVDMTVFRQDRDLRYAWMVQPEHGAALDMVIGHTDADLFSPTDALEITAIKRQALLTGQPVRQEITIGSAPEPQHFLLALQPLREASGAVGGLLGACLNITEHKAAQERMAFLAHHDTLTGLPNRLLARDRAGQAMALADRHQSKVALLFIDLDHFKTINDTLGHPAGDALLRELANRLQHCVRESDTISRQGGDEFLILLTDLDDAETVIPVVTKIVEQASAPVEVNGQDLSGTLSVGIAVYPDDGPDFDTLLKKADTAMYHAKQAGRNTYRFFAEQMNQNLLHQVETLNGLRRALERNELELFYQPQVRIRDGAVLGVEALLRWRHPERGLVAPSDFIPVAEESGLIIPIGEWVLRQAMNQAVAWHAAGYPDLVMAVNLSALQVRRGGLDLIVQKLLHQTGMPPTKLELELTESLLIDDMEVVRSTLHSVKAMGVRLSIDDFGTGYSSLSYLQRLEVDLLKIDQSFIRGIGNEQTAAIVRAIVQMAHSLNLSTIAEGVEDQAALRFLANLQCDAVQGYFYSRPLPAAELLRWLSQHGSRHLGENI